MAEDPARTQSMNVCVCVCVCVCAGIKPASPALAGGFFTTEPPEKSQKVGTCCRLNPWRPNLRDPSINLNLGRIYYKLLQDQENPSTA